MATWFLRATAGITRCTVRSTRTRWGARMYFAGFLGSAFKSVRRVTLNLMWHTQMHCRTSPTPDNRIRAHGYIPYVSGTVLFVYGCINLFCRYIAIRTVIVPARFPPAAERIETLPQLAEQPERIHDAACVCVHGLGRSGCVLPSCKRRFDSPFGDSANITFLSPRFLTLI